MFFFIAFVGALSSLTSLPGFGSKNYTSFQYVFALMQSAGFTGAMGGFAMSEDFETGFMDRLMMTASARFAIILGYVIAMLGRLAIAVAVLTRSRTPSACGSTEGLPDRGLFGLAVLLNIIATLWATGVAMRVRSFAAAPGMFLPIFLLFFLAPVFLPLSQLEGWLHSVRRLQPVHAAPRGRPRIHLRRNQECSGRTERASLGRLELSVGAGGRAPVSRSG